MGHSQNEKDSTASAALATGRDSRAVLSGQYGAINTAVAVRVSSPTSSAPTYKFPS